MALDTHSSYMAGIATGFIVLGLIGTVAKSARENKHQENMVGSIIPVYAEQSANKLESVEVEPQTGLIKLLANRQGEALAVIGNGDGSTTTNSFGNIYDAALMEYAVGEKVPTVFVDDLPKYGEQQ